MKLQFKHQKFQADAAKAVVDVFAGQPYLTPTYMMDRGDGNYQIGLEDDTDFTGWRNERIVPELSDRMILEHLQKVQRTNQIKPSDKLEGRYNLTIEMETGVGKTYTYIKTMYELNKHYGWSKFIVVVPSIAIREGVYKSFQVTQEHFAEEYGKKIRFFIYNSAQLTEIDRFASDSSINVITYNVLDEHYDTDIFTEPTIKGKLGTNAMKAQRHLYDHIVYDSTNERDFATDLDTNTDVAVYVKLPDSFYIATPVGHYNPDWAIAFYEGTVKHIYFVAETKGSMSSMQLRLIEESKIHCAREHFKAISSQNVVYDVVDSYQTLLEKVMK